MYEREKILDLFRDRSTAWNARVERGIEEHRKGDITLSVVDKEGKPVENAEISFTQKSHAFRFGANLFMLDEFDNEEKDKKYKETFASVFNMATLPFYWDTLEPVRGCPRYAEDSPRVYRRPAIDKCIRFCEENGIEPREHGLAYDGFFPKWLYDADTAEIKRELTRRYKEISERYADKIRTIEVTNELEWGMAKPPFTTNVTLLSGALKPLKSIFRTTSWSRTNGPAWCGVTAAASPISITPISKPPF